jgi:aminopeptidase N
MGKSVARLYTQFQPESYDLTWHIDEAAMQFTGTVTVKGKKVGRPSQRLTFHANGVKVTSGKVAKRDKKGEVEQPLKRINHQKTLHEVRLHTEDMAYPGEYTVTMEFEGRITDGMTGIYPCYWKDAEGNEQKMIATQFESHHAREAFPCIDEPEAKAVFNLTLITEGGIQVLANTPMAEQVPATSHESRVTKKTLAAPLQTTFKPTPRMSTYLLAFVIGGMHKQTAQTKSGVEVNIWATTAQPATSLGYALDVAVRSIEYFEDYFGVPYPLPKADHVALPDFSSGAMENWGLITYRERLLLAYEGETAQSTREQIALVIAHETSHQWFGNLVTMRWWNNLWLNESFANMMEYAAVDSMFPEWHVWDSFVAAEGLSSLRRDAVAGVQAVQTEVHHPDEISTLFDPSIVYAKGGRLLYMLKNYVGEAAFRKGLSAYFTRHAYGNTTGDDLWAALSEASGKDVRAFMTPWLTRSGFPVLTIDYENSELTLTQNQFLDDPAKMDETLLWPIPLFADQKSNEVKLNDVISESQMKFVGNYDELIIDPRAYGHYIVNYTSPVHLANLERQVSNQLLSEPGRLMLLNAQAMLARAGYKHYDEVLRLLGAYKNETSEPVWDIIAVVTGEARRFIDQDLSLEPKFKALYATLAQDLFKRLGWDERANESAADIKLRSLALGMMLYAENEAVTAEATKRFAGWKDHDEILPAELRSLIMVVPIKNGDRAAFDYLVARHDETNNSDLKSDICDALTGTRDPAWAAELLARLKDSNKVKPQDVDRWLIYLLRNRYVRDTAWAWMVENWQWLEDTFKNDKSYDYLPRYAASCVNTREYEAKFHDLFASKVDQPLLKRNIELGFEEIATRLSWLSRDLPAIQKYFQA